jgi:hypothetical protein
MANDTCSVTNFNPDDSGIVTSTPLKSTGLSQELDELGVHNDIFLDDELRLDDELGVHNDIFLDDELRLDDELGRPIDDNKNDAMDQSTEDCLLDDDSSLEKLEILLDLFDAEQCVIKQQEFINDMRFYIQPSKKKLFEKKLALMEDGEGKNIHCIIAVLVNHFLINFRIE